MKVGILVSLSWCLSTPNVDLRTLNVGEEGTKSNEELVLAMILIAI